MTGWDPDPRVRREIASSFSLGRGGIGGLLTGIAVLGLGVAALIATSGWNGLLVIARVLVVLAAVALPIALYLGVSRFLERRR